MNFRKITIKGKVSQMAQIAKAYNELVKLKDDAEYILNMSYYEKIIHYEFYVKSRVVTIFRLFENTNKLNFFRLETSTTNMFKAQTLEIVSYQQSNQENKVIISDEFMIQN